MRREPALALGTVQFGVAYGIAGAGHPVAEADAVEILRQAYAVGVRRLDTAAAYGDIEQRLGRLVGDLDFSVVSKLPTIPVSTSETDVRRWIQSSITQSHARLGHLLVGMLFHDPSALSRPDAEIVWDAAAEACDRLGIGLGISAYDPSVTTQLAARFPLTMVQVPGSAFDQRYRDAQRGLSGIETTLRSIFLQGLLLLDPEDATRRLPQGRHAFEAWSQWCCERGLGRLEGAVAIARSFDANYCVVGVDSPAQFEMIARAWADAITHVAPELAVEALSIIDPRTWPGKA